MRYEIYFASSIFSKKDRFPSLLKESIELIILMELIELMVLMESIEVQNQK